MARESDTARPSYTSFAARRRASSVMWLSVPSSSSSPQRPQLENRAGYAAYSSTVGGVRSASPMVPPCVAAWSCALASRGFEADYAEVDMSTPAAADEPKIISKGGYEK